MADTLKSELQQKSCYAGWNCSCVSICAKLHQKKHNLAFTMFPLNEIM